MTHAMPHDLITEAFPMSHGAFFNLFAITFASSFAFSPFRLSFPSVMDDSQTQFTILVAVWSGI